MATIRRNGEKRPRTRVTDIDHFHVISPIEIRSSMSEVAERLAKGTISNGRATLISFVSPYGRAMLSITYTLHHRLPAFINFPSVQPSIIYSYRTSIRAAWIATSSRR